MVRIRGPDREIYRHDGCLTPVPRRELQKKRRYEDMVDSDQDETCPPVHWTQEMMPRLWRSIRGMRQITCLADLEMLGHYVYCYKYKMMQLQ